MLSLQGKIPLTGHPKTLRDLTNATELLTLPSTFGTIQLGETFSSCLCINNETSFEIEGVNMKVEMQTVTTKVTLAEHGGKNFRLATGDSLEKVVSHEIKELGQHVLACTVTYRLPPTARHAPGSAEDASDPSLQTFRKFYKFAVSNPLSVKTKVHAPRSPSALMSTVEREKIFLEVHIQNLTQESMWFERMSFECLDGWQVIDANVDDGEKGSIFSGPMAIMQPQDMRQYIYILRPISIPSFPISHAPGTIIPLGRLDISWRSSFGEPGRLLTSMLSRRIAIPPAPVQQPASALPLYLQRTPSLSSAAPSRPRSPQIVQSRPATPLPQRPGSPFRIRSVIGPSLPSTPVNAPVPLPSSTPGTSAASDIEVDVVIHQIPRNSIVIEKPFTITLRLTVSAPVSAPLPSFSQNDKQLSHRLISLAVQHVQAPRTVDPTPTMPALISDTFNPRLPSDYSTPSPIGTPWRGGAFTYEPTHEKLLTSSPVRHENEETSTDVMLPPPFSEQVAERKFGARPDVVFIGSSVVFLPPIWFPSLVQMDRSIDGRGATASEAVQDFELSFLPLRKGLVTMGGLRVLLVEDKMVDRGESLPDADEDKKERMNARSEVQTLRQWEIIGEIWVTT